MSTDKNVNINKDISKSVTTDKNVRYRNRVKITNMVKRKPEIKKQCCICGSTDAEILHNKYDPYVIAFICKKCRLDKEKVKKAESCRFDIREVMSKSTLSVKNFAIKDVKELVENFLVETLSIGAYCSKVGVSRHQFNQLIERYKKTYNDLAIKKKIINHTNKVNRENLSKIKYNKSK